jgi:ribosome maturation factor RimP
MVKSAKVASKTAKRAERSGSRAGARDVFARERDLAREIAPLVERGVPGVDVLAVELVSPSRFCVYVDHPQGVDHALCARVTHELEPWRAEYTIDVSSPGPERPLRKPGHFARAVGSMLTLRTSGEIGGKSRLRGELRAASATGITVATTDGEVEIPYETVLRANLIDESN